MTNVEKYTYRPDTRKRFRLIYENIPQEAATILDIGCARYQANIRNQNDLHGFLSNECNAKIKGIDVNETAVTEMQKQGYDVEVADAETFSISEKFDVIIAGEVIEYITNPRLFVENCLDHLSSKGKIIITTENPYAFVHWRKSLTGNYQPNYLWIDPFHIPSISDRINEGDVQINWLSPDGGVSSLLWKLGYKQSAAPLFCAVINPKKDSYDETT